MIGAFDSLYYVLNDAREPVPVDVEEWARMFEDMDRRRVAFTELVPGSTVSTVFLGMNHAWGHGPPLLFETMAFGPGADDEMRRYSTWAQAEAGHAEVVELVAGRLKAAQS